MNEQSLSRYLAFFSFGLGAAQLLAPRQLARAIGLKENHEGLLRACGGREITSGLAVLQSPRVGLEARVAGDLMDIGLLTTAWRDPENDRQRLGIALAAVGAVTAFDVFNLIQLHQTHADPRWRVRRANADRAGMPSDDPVSHRMAADAAMEHQSGHLTDHPATASTTPKESRPPAAAEF